MTARQAPKTSWHLVGRVNLRVHFAPLERRAPLGGEGGGTAFGGGFAESGVVDGEGFVVAVEALEDAGFVDLGSGALGVEAEGFFVSAKGEFEAVHAFPGDAFLEMGLGVFGVAGESFLETGDGFLEAVHIEKDLTLGQEKGRAGALGGSALLCGSVLAVGLGGGHEFLLHEVRGGVIGFGGRDRFDGLGVEVGSGLSMAGLELLDAALEHFDGTEEFGIGGVILFEKGWLVVLGQSAGDFNDPVEAAHLEPVAEEHEDDQSNGGCGEKPEVEGLGLLDEFEFAVLLGEKGLIQIGHAVGEGVVFLGKVFPFAGGLGIGALDGVELIAEGVDLALGGERGGDGGLVRIRGGNSGDDGVGDGKARYEEHPNQEEQGFHELKGCGERRNEGGRRQGKFIHNLF